MTADHDLFQVARDGVDVLFVGTRGRTVDPLRPPRPGRRYGVEPRQLPSLTALVGDASDNLPKVPGVGARTAQRLVQRFGDMRGLIEGLEQSRPRGCGASWRRRPRNSRDRGAGPPARRRAASTGPRAAPSAPTPGPGCAPSSPRGSSTACFPASTCWHARRHWSRPTTSFISTCERPAAQRVPAHGQGTRYASSERCFRIELNPRALACGQNDDVGRLYSTLNTALRASQTESRPRTRRTRSTAH